MKVRADSWCRYNETNFIVSCPRNHDSLLKVCANIFHDTLMCVFSPRTIVVAVGLLVSVTACSSAPTTRESETTNTEAPTTTIGPASSGDTSLNAFVPDGFSSLVTSDGRTRSYKVVDLSNGDEEVPVVFMLHGFGGTAGDMGNYTGVETALTEAGISAIVVYPNGTGAESGAPQSWNAGGCCPFAMFEPVDDVAFFSSMIDAVNLDYSTDPDQVWVIGHSNGGMMAYRLACELSEKVSAIGVAAGALMVDSCSATRAVNVLHLHGELDSVVPLTGGESLGITFPSTRDSVDRYADSARCTRSASDTATRTEFACGSRTVLLVTDPTWTHDWQPDWARRFVEFFVATARA